MAQLGNSCLFISPCKMVHKMAFHKGTKKEIDWSVWSSAGEAHEGKVIWSTKQMQIFYFLLFFFRHKVVAASVGLYFYLHFLWRWHHAFFEQFYTCSTDKLLRLPVAHTTGFIFRLFCGGFQTLLLESQTINPRYSRLFQVCRRECHFLFFI